MKTPAGKAPGRWGERDTQTDAGNGPKWAGSGPVLGLSWAHEISLSFFRLLKNRIHTDNNIFAGAEKAGSSSCQIENPQSEQLSIVSTKSLQNPS